ncbi:MAG: hypothetical protein GF330_03325 [Candidatus Eisenbacteria bacterium]|nr:hypothetical protein [Candidatus Eisenbacteria bacterium]
MILLGIALGVLPLSCASYTSRLGPLRGMVSAGELDDALALIAEHGEPGELLYHLERGALLHHLQRYEESNQELERAAQVYADRYTISVSQRGLTFLLNDEIEAYAGEVYEGNYLHYYRILNFLARGAPRSAAVEARRLALRLTELQERAPEPALAGDPFLEYLSGIALEAVGEWNSALIAYRRAQAGYEAQGAALGLDAPPSLQSDILRTAHRAGIAPEEIGFGAAEAVGARPRQAAQIVLLLETGWPPQKVSEHLRIPIFRQDPATAGDADATWSAGVRLAERYDRYQATGVWGAAEREIDYWLDVAVPVLAPSPQVQGCEGRSRIRRVGDHPPAGADDRADEAVRGGQGAAGVYGPLFAELVSVADLGALVTRAYARDRLAVIAKAAARALLKYTAHRQAEKQWGALGGLLANVAGVATEKADTRGWLMLPGEICLARVTLPAGEYEVELELPSAHGSVLATPTRRVRVARGEIAVLSWRRYR